MLIRDFAPFPINLPRIRWKPRRKSASHRQVTTSPDPDASANEPMVAPYPAGGDGWLFLLCDPAPSSSDAETAAAQTETALLHRMGLTGPHLPVAQADGALPLSFGGTAVDLYPDARTRPEWQQLNSAQVHVAGPPPDPALLREGRVIALRLPQGPTAGCAARAQHLCAIAALLAPLYGARHMGWTPANLWSDAAALGNAVIAMQATAVPPVLHLIAFTAMADAASDGVTLHSHGLDWFAGFELALTASPPLAMGEMLRRAARLAVDVMLHGDPQGPRDTPGLATGERLHIAPLTSAANGTILPVRIIAQHHR